MNTSGPSRVKRKTMMVRIPLLWSWNVWETKMWSYVVQLYKHGTKTTHNSGHAIPVQATWSRPLLTNNGTVFFTLGVWAHWLVNIIAPIILAKKQDMDPSMSGETVKVPLVCLKYLRCQKQYFFFDDAFPQNIISWPRNS